MTQTIRTTGFIALGFILLGIMIGCKGEKDSRDLPRTNTQKKFVSPKNNGDLFWVKQADVDGYNNVIGISALSDNSIVVAGNFGDSITLGPGEKNQTTLKPSGNDEIFIARFNSDGALEWVKTAGGPDNASVSRITALPDDSVVLTGNYYRSITFGAGEINQTELNTERGYDGNYIARYNPDGTLAWAKPVDIGIRSITYAIELTGLSDSSIVLTGTINAVVIYNENEPDEIVLHKAFGRELQNEGIFIARYNPDGSLAWVKKSEETEVCWCQGITSLSDDSTVIIGNFTGLTNFGPCESNNTELKSSGKFDIFIVKYNPDGTLAWAKSAGGPADDDVKGITSLSDDSTVMVGSFRKYATFGNGEEKQTILNGVSGTDGFIARYNPDGLLAWVNRIGESGNDDLSEITTLSDDSVITTGVYYSVITLGPGEPKQTVLTCGGDYRAFFARYNPDGTIEWARHIWASRGGDESGILTLSDDSVVMSGWYLGPVTFGEGEPNETILPRSDDFSIFLARFAP